MGFYSKYRKFFVAALGAAVTAFLAVYTDGVTREEWLYIAASVGAALGVWTVPNAPNRKVKDSNNAKV